MTSEETGMLCDLIRRMSPEQIARYMVDPQHGIMFANHIAYCEDDNCKKVLAESEQRAAQAYDRTPFERWKKDLVTREILHMARFQGVLVR